MRILIACEESQEVCKAFRELGHEAYSCDILPCSGGHPEWHIQDDVLNHLYDSWDAIIAFVPCYRLAVCGARWFKGREEEQEKAVQFFMQIWNAPVEFMCIENPVGIMSTRFRKPDQVIQPWMHGHGETKATCLWLRGFPKLLPSNIVKGREHRIWKMAPSPNRSRERSKTFPGVAKAMAVQWGKKVLALPGLEGGKK